MLVHTYYRSDGRMIISSKYMVSTYLNIPVTSDGVEPDRHNNILHNPHALIDMRWPSGPMAQSTTNCLNACGQGTNAQKDLNCLSALSCNANICHAFLTEQTSLTTQPTLFNKENKQFKIPNVICLTTGRQIRGRRKNDLGSKQYLSKGTTNPDSLITSVKLVRCQNSGWSLIATAVLQSSSAPTAIATLQRLEAQN